MIKQGKSCCFWWWQSSLARPALLEIRHINSGPKQKYSDDWRATVTSWENRNSTVRFALCDFLLEELPSLGSPVLGGRKPQSHRMEVSEDRAQGWYRGWGKSQKEGSHQEDEPPDQCINPAQFQGTHTRVCTPTRGNSRSLAKKQKLEAEKTTPRFCCLTWGRRFGFELRQVNDTSV